MVHDASAHGYRGWITVFLYRLLINGRGMAYFYLGIMYDLDVVYLELTLVRVILSWVGAIILCALVPAFIGVSTGEAKRVFHPVNVLFKCCGTVFVVLALVLINRAPVH